MIYKSCIEIPNKWTQKFDPSLLEGRFLAKKRSRTAKKILEESRDTQDHDLCELIKNKKYEEIGSGKTIPCR